MMNALRVFLDFFRKNYKLLAILTAVVLFFWFYNTYLVDRSLLNLRFILEKVSAMKDNLDDARKITMILEAMRIKEMALHGDVEVKPEDLEAAEKILAQAQETPELNKETQQLRDALRYAVVKQEPTERGKVMIDMLTDIQRKPQSVSQLEDARFALKEMISDQEQKRPPFLALIDRVAQAVLPKKAGMSRERLEQEASLLKRRLRDIKDKDRLQKAFYELANILTQLGQIKSANAFYKQAVALQKDNSLAEKAKFNLAWNEKTTGDLERALAGFQDLSQETSDPELKVFLQFQTADILRKQSRYKEAIEHSQYIIRAEPGLDLTQLSNYIVGQIYLYNLGDTEKAKQEFEKAKEINEASDFSRFIDKQADPAIAEQYLALGFNLLRQAYFMSMPEKYSGALNNFDRVLAINPKDGLSYAGKSLIYLWLGEREKSLEASKKAVRLMPDNEVVSVNLAYIYIELKMIDEAIAELKRLVALKPKIWQAYYNLGFAYIVKNDFAEAADAFEKSAETNPYSARILNNEGWCKWKLGKYAEAIHLFERALFIEPQFRDALFNIGLIYKASGKYSEAKAKLDELFKIAPGYPDLDYYLSDIDRLIRMRSKD
jgi:tetratricopeptide (TPR) repeat protein